LHVVKEGRQVSMHACILSRTHDASALASMSSSVLSSQKRYKSKEKGGKSALNHVFIELVTCRELGRAITRMISDTTQSRVLRISRAVQYSPRQVGARRV
jgi:hypothetical protein